MFKKILASVGIGAAKVDTRLFNDIVFPGDDLEGEVYICGGDVDQEIDDIYLKLATQYKRDVDDSTVKEECVLVKYLLSERLTIQAKEELTIPFTFVLPYDLPLTMGQTPVYIRTGLDIKTAINPRDRDEIQVQPTSLMQTVFDSLQELGFELRRVECEYAPKLGRNYPFVQEFEFRPIGKYRQSVDELDLILRSPHPEELEVLMEIDRRAQGLGGWLNEAFDLDERYARFSLTEADLGFVNLTQKIDELIQSRL